MSYQEKVDRLGLFSLEQRGYKVTSKVYTIIRGALKVVGHSFFPRVEESETSGIGLKRKGNILRGG